MRKYSLARVLEEIRRDAAGSNGAGKEAPQKVLSQEQIRAMTRARRAAAAAKKALEREPDVS